MANGKDSEPHRAAELKNTSSKTAKGKKTTPPPPTVTEGMVIGHPCSRRGRRASQPNMCLQQTPATDKFSQAPATHMSLVKTKSSPSSKAQARSSEVSKTKDSSDLSLMPLVMEQMKLFLNDVLSKSLASNPYTLRPTESGTEYLRDSTSEKKFAHCGP